jgi:hypothetical protein
LTPIDALIGWAITGAIGLVLHDWWQRRRDRRTVIDWDGRLREDVDRCRN